jgi:DNA polymerase III epsilon subunit-like protein
LYDTPFFKNRLDELLRRDWTPNRGVGSEAILFLLASIGTSPEEIAQDCGVTPQFVRQVCTQVKVSEKVRKDINAWLTPYGLTPDNIWGIGSSIRIPAGAIPPEFLGIPTFVGQIIPAHHEIVLLADCETSGTNHNQHVAVEIALLKVILDCRPEKGYRVLGAIDGFVGYQDPGICPVNPISMRTHGIPVNDLVGKHLDQEDLQRVLLGATSVIAHNASFDRRFMTKAIPGLLGLPWVCSMIGVPWKALGYEASNLKTLAKAFKLPMPGHRAPQDVVALYHLLNQVLPAGETVISEMVASYASGSE